MSNSKKSTGQKAAAKPKTIWDNDLPAGDAPALPRWPLTLSIVAYSLWMIFLLSMMVLRLVGQR